ncbi:MAG: HAD family hydrolase, partial [Candidatus Kariarchaeaceae archaeon]
MSSSQPILFLDLHGVLVQTPQILEDYRRITVQHQIDHFQLAEDDAMNRYDHAMEMWEKKAFGYLRNPSKKKVGPEFLDFLEWCDKLFPKYLYEGMEINQECPDLRTRPFEYIVASQIEALYPEVLSTLAHLKEHGYRMYVASSSHSSHIEGIVEANGLDDYIDGIFGFDTVAATKHTMKYYKDMISQTEAEAQYCFMIGNSMHEVLKPR